MDPPVLDHILFGVVLESGTLRIGFEGPAIIVEFFLCCGIGLGSGELDNFCLRFCPFINFAGWMALLCWFAGTVLSCTARTS